MYLWVCHGPCCHFSYVFSKVAHFYNTIDQQMIPSQQPMMLDAAMAFEHVIKDPCVSTKDSKHNVRHVISIDTIIYAEN